MSYVISGESTADLSKEYFQSRDIRYICFRFFLDGKEIPDDLGETMPFDQFYQAMVDGADTRTAQINEEEYYTYFKSFLSQGQDMIHLTLSSGISGTLNSAMLAKNRLDEEYPDRKLYVIDSLAASSGFGLLLDMMADRRDAGMSVDALADWCEKNRLKVNHWFFSTDLTFFIKGGRVSKTAGFFGQMLSICPLLNVDYQGRLIPREKIRTKRKVIRVIEEHMEAMAEDRMDYSGKVFISNSACYEDARAVADLVESRFPKLNGKVQIFSIGTTIGSHTGPGTVALFFFGDERVD